MKKILAFTFVLGVGINAYSQVTINSVTSTSTTCSGNCDGTITIDASTAMPPLYYSIDNGVTFQSSNVFTNVCSGVYDIVVEDGMAIPEYYTEVVSDGSGPILSLLTLNDASCFGYADGGIYLSATGGTAPFTYSGTDTPADPFLTNVAAGNYSVSITDANNCTDIATYTVYEPDPIDVWFNTVVDASCNGGSDGSATSGVSGGDFNYSYSWSNGPITPDIINVMAGTYTLTVSDGNGCFGSADAIIGEPDPITVGISGVGDVTCNGANDGYISTNITGGDWNYTYSWSNGGVFQDLNNVGPGNYVLSVTDGNGCTGASSVITVNEPQVLTAVISIVDSISCYGGNDGKLAVNVTGGTLGYNYTWTTGGSTNDTSYNVFSGYQEVEITDGNGCFAVANITVPEPQSLFVSFTSTDVLCYGACDGTVTASASGGTPGYTYAWDDPNSQTTATASGLCENILSTTDYMVTVTDANGCSITESSRQFGAYIAEPDSLNVTVSWVDATCSTSDGSATAVVTGGMWPYSYSWSSGGNAAMETGLTNGNYSIDIVDSNGCMVSDTAYIGLTVFPIDVCVVTVDSTSTKNVVVWTKPVATNISHFNIYRDIVGTYTYVASVSYDSLSQFEDNTGGVNPAVTQYRYKISVVDSCGNESTLSNYHQTIHLNAPNLVGNTADLVWQEYTGISGNYYYRILRDSTLTNTWEVVDSVSSTTLVYTDIAVPSTPSVRYLVQIAFSNTCSATKAQDHNSTRSNRATISGSGTPNAIDELSEELFTVVPNPNNGVFSIQFRDNSQENRLITITDLQGKIVTQLTTQYGETQKLINLSAFDNGIYFIKVKAESGAYSVRRIVKQ